VAENKHIHSFDYLRVIAALGVIYMHVASGALRAELNAHWHCINVITSAAFTAVPLFFMISGYLLLTDPKTADIGILLKRRLPRLVIPLAAWTVVACLWKMKVGGDASFAGFA